jgi:hypothetical protein
MNIAVVQRRLFFFEGWVERLVSLRRSMGLVGYVIGLARRIGGEFGVGVSDVGCTRLLGHSSKSIDRRRVLLRCWRSVLKSGVDWTWSGHLRHVRESVVGREKERRAGTTGQRVWVSGFRSLPSAARESERQVGVICLVPPLSVSLRNPVKKKSMVTLGCRVLGLKSKPVASHGFRISAAERPT